MLLKVTNKTNRTLPISTNISVEPNSSITIDESYGSKLRNMVKHGFIFVEVVNEVQKFRRSSRIPNSKDSKELK